MARSLSSLRSQEQSRSSCPQRKLLRTKNVEAFE